MELWGNLDKVWELNCVNVTDNFAKGLSGVTAALLLPKEAIAVAET